MTGIDAETDRATFVSAEPRPTFCQYCGSATAWLGEKTWPTQLKCTICPATREVSAAALAERAEELLREIPAAVDNAIREACRGIADPNEVRRRLMHGWVNPDDPKVRIAGWLEIEAMRAADSEKTVASLRGREDMQPG